jgi:heat shock protein HtpX
MVNLVLRSFIVLALLFGLVFAIGIMVLFATGLPLWLAVPFAVFVVALQYLLGPFVLQWIYKIRWVDPAQFNPQLAAFIAHTCQERNIPRPRFGVIDDGNPNAFTFGHYPGNARLVVTCGLLQMLSPQEVEAVVGHEMGHIAHWDFVVMTVAAVVPLVLYTLWIATRSGRSRKGGGYIALIGVLSYIAYVVSQYIVLLLSRVREYYADRFAGEVTRNPDALATGLVKIAYGLARAPESGQAKNDVRMQAARAFGVFDPKVAKALALVGAGSGNLSSAAMEGAMKWDLWNPWAGWYELSSSHPLPAKRIKALEKQSEAQGRIPSFSFRAVQPESYWDEFLVDLAINQFAWIGFVFGLGIAAAGFLFGLPLAGIGVGLLVWGAAWWLQRRFIYPPDLDAEQNVKELVGQVKVSKVRAVSGTLRGRIIGRGVPGLFYSEDLVLQDATGFIVLDYRQPWRLFEFLFGLLRAEKYVGQTGAARGWFRRVPQPVFELRELALDDGKKVTSWVYPLAQFFVYALMVLGALMLIGQAALMFVR